MKSFVTVSSVIRSTFHWRNRSHEQTLESVWVWVGVCGGVWVWVGGCGNHTEPSVELLELKGTLTDLLSHHQEEELT